ncbi:DUF3710 domain-containing protein [Nocardioides acrostichi]|uniref:DUF3710 domain-containing protein n=1 Tax=Nocardioides acrostichi TaxID=2784339 RepID=A0A930YBZ6_9ACTN|nr:DUF3710 domain-containing protein [Nocardioides acrostichi]MBF4160974.1 DUF3710 domain-containing protein [Nocardioides acrostichi]
MKFRRKSASPTDAAAEEVESAQAPGLTDGPFDIDDAPALPEGGQRVDLGSLLITPAQGIELRIQVDDSTGEVQAVILAGPDGALELRAFAAPRGGDLWSEVRPQIAADMAQRGGTATEAEGRFGTELECQVTRQLPDGTTGAQASRIVGVNGPRWLLRATFIGAPAQGGDAVEGWENLLGAVVVSRGTGAMPVGEALPVILPDGARPVS